MLFRSKRLGDKEEFCTSNFFKRLENELHNNTYKVLDDVLNDSIHILMKDTYLQNKEIDELKKLIFTLGKSDIESQSRMIDLSIENLKKATFEELIQIPDVGDIVAECIIDFFNEEKVIETIDELLELGVNPVFEEKEIIESVFENKTVVVTGTMKKYSRKQIKDKLEMLGAKVSGSVSKDRKSVV